MLNLKELYQVAQAGGALLQSKNYVAALVKYIACMMKSCQEILQVKASADLINENGGENASQSIKELISDTDKVFELARQCLTQSDAIVHSFFGLPPSQQPQQPQQPQQSQPQSPKQQPRKTQSQLPQLRPSMSQSSISPKAGNPMLRTFTSGFMAKPSQQPPHTLSKASSSSSLAPIAKSSLSTLSSMAQSSPSGLSQPSTDKLPELLLLEGVHVSENNRRNICEMGAQSIESINEPALLLQQQLAALRAKIEAAVSRERGLAQTNTSRVFELRSQFLRQNYELMNIAKAQQTSRVNQVLSEYYAINQARELSAAEAEAEARAATMATEKVKAALMNSTSRQIRHIDALAQTIEKEQAAFKMPKLRMVGDSVKEFAEKFSGEMITTYKARETEFDGIVELCTDTVVFRCYDTIFPMFKKVTESDDMKTNSRLKVLHSMITPEAVKARRKFWLVPEETDPKDAQKVMDKAYAETIAAFSLIGKTKTLFGKLKCLKAAVDSVSAAVEKFYGKITEDLVMGADDLLPILSFSLFRSGLLNTHAEVEFISELLSDKQSMGENGYNAATFAALIGFVDTITPQDLENSNK